MQLNEHDLYLIKRCLPKRVANILKTFEHKVFLAGGFIRAVIAKEVKQDIDLFVETEDAAELLAKALLFNSEQYRVTTDNAITVYDRTRQTIPIQIITRWLYKEPDDLMASFDYTICQAVVYWAKGEKPLEGAWCSTCSDKFYQDLAAKRLTYTNPKRNEDAGGSILRVLKYYQRGYTIPLTDLGQVIARLMTGVRANKLSIEELCQNPVALGLVLRGLLREVDPLIDPDHIIKESHEEKVDSEEIK